MGEHLPRPAIFYSCGTCDKRFDIQSFVLCPVCSTPVPDEFCPLPLSWAARFIHALQEDAIFAEDFDF